MPFSFVRLANADKGSDKLRALEQALTLWIGSAWQVQRQRGESGLGTTAR